MCLNKAREGLDTWVDKHKSVTLMQYEKKYIQDP